VIYRDAMSLELVDAGYAWIVTEQALLPHNTPIGCTLSSLNTSFHNIAVKSFEFFHCEHYVPCEY